MACSRDMAVTVDGRESESCPGEQEEPLITAPMTRQRQLQKTPLAVAGTACLAAAVWIALHVASGSHPTRASKASESQVVGGWESKDCAAPAEDSECMKSIRYAMSDGIYAHPEWYPGVEPGSNDVATFQNSMWKSGQPKKAPCPRPCEAGFVKPPGCRDVNAQYFPMCFKTVMWMKQTGINQPNTWGQGLTAASSLAQFQCRKHAQDPAVCPPPCSERCPHYVDPKAPKVIVPPDLVAAPECKNHPKCHGLEGKCCPNSKGSMLDCCEYTFRPADERSFKWGDYTVRNDWHPDAPVRSAPPDHPRSFWSAENVGVEDDALNVCIRQNSGWESSWAQDLGGMIVQDSSPSPNESWAFGEAVIDDELYYGEYVVQIDIVDNFGKSAWERLLTQDTTVTAGIFLFDQDRDGAGENIHRELDIVEVGFQNQNKKDPNAWINRQPDGPRAPDSNAHFALQPVKITPDEGNGQSANWDHVHRISLDPEELAAYGGVTFAMRWMGPGEPVTFACVPGSFTSQRFPWDGQWTKTWTSPDSASIDVPARSSSLRMHLNLWAYGGPTSRKPLCMKVKYLDMPKAPSSMELERQKEEAEVWQEEKVVPDNLKPKNPISGPAMTADYAIAHQGDVVDKMVQTAQAQKTAPPR
eukprot:TRINITY_DN48884_c0_g1_i1.p1 TRINITY_DN48884_c0_g1~~TRINITY_DN48884_c0_g1_i1.p1  ORF type:complete len:641 (+),score=96.01 TRINITY_DN48884_c0_g1_i1:77-1999(+)